MEEEISPELSVVIACLDVAGLESILIALQEPRSGDVETIVVSESDLAPSCSQFPGVRFLTVPGAGLTPRLWAAGIEAAKGRLIATTTSNFLPSPNYAAAAVEAHRRLPSAGIGGRINPPAGRNPTAWAVYLLRYSAYLGRSASQRVEDFAGDNGVYKAAALVPYVGFIREQGFWEHEVHQMMLKNGEGLSFDPSIEVRQISAYAFLDFVNQRFQHGRLYGAGLTQGRSLARRVALACRGTLVPALLVYRVARSVFKASMYQGAFLRALPALVCFASAWGAGETLGCLGALRNR